MRYVTVLGRMALVSAVCTAGALSACGGDDDTPPVEQPGGEGGGGAAQSGASTGGSSMAGSLPGGSSTGGSMPSAGEGGMAQVGGASGGANGGSNDSGFGGVETAGAGGSAPMDWLTWPSTTPPTWDGSLSTAGVCSINGICWNYPYQSNNNLYSVWSASPTDTWLAGSPGMLVHYDGQSFRGITAIEPGHSKFTYVRGPVGSSSNVWALGVADNNDQLLYRFDGNKWHKMTAPIYPVRSISPVGAASLWAACEGKFVAHWDGAQWKYTNVGIDVIGVYAFSDSDVWVENGLVRHFNGTDWEDKGSPAGGQTIWGASSGDMWTGDGSHLAAGMWTTKTGAGTGFKRVVGAAANNLFFLGQGDTPLNYYLVGNFFGPTDNGWVGAQRFDVWPLSSADYWVVGERVPASGAPTIQHGDPSQKPKTFGAGGPSIPDEPAPPYTVVGKTLLYDDGNGAMPLKTFDSAFSGQKFMAWTADTLWVCNGGALYQYSGGNWTTPSNAPTCGDRLQVDGDGHLWVQSGNAVSVYNGQEVRALPNLPVLDEEIRDFTVRDHDAWALTQQIAYRWSDSQWDAYAIGADLDIAPTRLEITAGGTVHLGGSTLIYVAP